MILVIAFLSVIVFLVLGISIPLTFLGAAAIIVYCSGSDPMFLLSYGGSQINNVLLLTIPLFVLAGAVIDHGGIGRRLINSVEKLGFGKIKGGLGIVTAISSAVFGAISGSAGATIACIGSIMSPRLEENGYEKGFIGSLISSCAVLGLLIPPSMSMILYGWVGGQSVLACFLATIIPGIILVILFSTVNLFYAAKNKNIVKSVDSKPVASTQGKKKSSIPALLMPFVILGAIYGGVMTTTEAAALSVIYAIPVAMLYYREMSMGDLRDSLISAGKTTGVIMMMLFSVMILSRLYTMNNVPQMLLFMLTSISDSPAVIMIMINLFMILLGMLMDDTSGVLLATPILLPIVTELGVSPIQFAAIVGVNLGMGNITPPTAPLLYLGGKISGAEVKEMLPHTMRLILFAWLPTLIITTYVPDLSLFLPRLFGYC